MKNKKYALEILRKKRKVNRSYNFSIKIYLKKVLMNRFILSITSGLIVGVVFGLLSLHILLNETAETAGNNGQATDISANLDNDEKESDLTATVELPDIYVVQVGLFQNNENALENKRTLSASQVPAVIWERDQQFYMFAAVHSKQALAKEVIDKLSDKDIESFVKQWKIKTDSQSLNNEERGWIKQFVTLWIDTLHKLESEQNFPIDKWQQLADKSPKNSEKLSRLQSIINETLKDVKEDSNNYITLLHVLYEFEKTMK